MMMEKHETICKEILNLFEETFEKVHGQFLDRGTSFFETIDALSAGEASMKRGSIPESIAGHVNHVIFYMVVLQEYITDVRSGKTDWGESWKVEKVDTAEWTELRGRLRREYGKLREFVSGVEAWDNGDYSGGLMAILAHTAYHLGAIRQLMLM